MQLEGDLKKGQDGELGDLLEGVMKTTNIVALFESVIACSEIL
jgi:hypothetical protein